MSEENPQIKKLGTVESKIRHIVKTMGADVDYMFMNWAQANVTLDSIAKPTVVYVLPASGKLDVQWSEVKDRPDSFIAFVSSTEFDFDGIANDNIIEAMKRLAIRFLRAYNESGLFEKIENDVPYRTLYDFLDQNVTGIVINPVLEELEGVSICDDIERIGFDEE